MPPTPRLSEPSLHIYHRVLYPTNGPPPPRILHSPASAALDPLILDLVALVCREHVLSWYSALSRDPDRAFIQQVSAIIIHVIQALEVRLANVDLVELLVLDLPTVLERHIRDYDQAGEKAGTGYAHSLAQDSVFHLLQPHIAVSLVNSGAGTPEPVVDKTYLRALADSLLRLLLPPEDYRAETERAIVREILVNIIFANAVFDKVAQPWFLHQAIAKVLEAKEEQARYGGADIGLRSDQGGDGRKTRSPASALFERGLAALGSLPRFVRAIGVSVSALYHTAIASPVPQHYRAQPPVTAPLFALLAALLPPSPLVAQAIHYLTLPLALFSTFVTSLIFYLVNEKLLTAKFAEEMLDTVTRGLFPDGHPPPKEADPDQEEQAALKVRCEEAVARALPSRVANLLISSTVSDAPLALSRHLLRPISSHIANVHLFILVVDLVVGKLFPELVLGGAE